MKVEVRERRAKQAKAQARKEFAKSMKAARDAVRQVLFGVEGPVPAGARPVWPAWLGARFVEWGEAYYKDVQDDTPMSAAHEEMREVFAEIQRTAAACHKATMARLAPKRRERQRKAKQVWLETRWKKVAAERAERKELLGKMDKDERKAFAENMEAACAVAKNAVAEKYSDAAVAAGTTKYNTNKKAVDALAEEVGDDFAEYAVNKMHTLMWDTHSLSKVSEAMEAKWAEIKELGE
jgi:hypothetical protein